MPEYKKVGYLTSSFKLFHLKDQNKKEFSYHYHDFHKILILLNGDITYCIEGRSYQLAPNDIVLVHAGEVHRPIIQSESPYERIIIYVSPDFLKKYKEPDCDLSHCLKQAAAEQSHVLRFHGSRAAKLKTAIQSLDHAKNDKDFAASLHQEILFLEFMIQLNRAAMHDGIEFINDVLQLRQTFDVHLITVTQLSDFGVTASKVTSFSQRFLVILTKDRPSNDTCNRS